MSVYTPTRDDCRDLTTVIDFSLAQLQAFEGTAGVATWGSRLLDLRRALTEGEDLPKAWEGSD